MHRRKPGCLFKDKFAARIEEEKKKTEFISNTVLYTMTSK